MEFINCENCQCWNQEHWTAMVEYDKKQIMKNERFGVCQRHAPSTFAVNQNHQVTNYYLIVLKKIIPLGVVGHNSKQRVTPYMRHDEGCWEGIRCASAKQDIYSNGGSTIGCSGSEIRKMEDIKEDG